MHPSKIAFQEKGTSNSKLLSQILYLADSNILGMRTDDLIREIQKLPVQKRIFVIEKSLHSLRMQEEKNQMNKAVDLLWSDYKSDKELTAFTNIDFEDFYEAK